MKKTKARVYIMIVLRPNEECNIVNKRTNQIVRTIRYDDIQPNQVVRVV
jgi:hypothetical protein